MAMSVRRWRKNADFGRRVDLVLRGYKKFDADAVAMVTRDAARPRADHDVLADRRTHFRADRKPGEAVDVFAA